MTRRIRRLAIILLTVLAGVIMYADSATELHASSTGNPLGRSATAKGMAGMQMAPEPAQSSRTVILKHQRSVHVNIHSLSFGPARIVVSVGTKIIWTNQDSFQHTTTSDRGLWDSGPINPGAHFVRVFKQAGTFTYHCTIHPFMHGTITVTK